MHVMKIHNRIDSRYMYTHARNLGCTSLEQNSHRRGYMKAVKICRASYFSRVDETFLSRPLLFVSSHKQEFHIQVLVLQRMRYSYRIIATVFAPSDQIGKHN